MLIARTLPELHRHLPRPGLALVPTMGALHAGHLALIAEARRQAPFVAASIFVNPLQFDAADDLARYPRTEQDDLDKLHAAGCDLVWLPQPDTMYPPGDCTLIELGGPATRWEGAARPGHFRGVATVVAKLFGQLRPELALFGEKDWQQLQVIRRMARDLLLPVRVAGLPTLREQDGLAMSSRNRFLSQEERRLAPLLYAVLREAAASPAAPDLAAAKVRLAEAGFVIDYLALVDAESLEPIQAGPGRLIAAARLGRVRLLDNVPAQ